MFTHDVNNYPSSLEEAYKRYCFFRYIPLTNMSNTFEGLCEMLQPFGEFEYTRMPDKVHERCRIISIIVVKKRSKDNEAWITTNRRRKEAEDLKLHTMDILEGAFSLHNEPDVAFVQEYIPRHKAFKKYQRSACEIIPASRICTRDLPVTAFASSTFKMNACSHFWKY